MRLKRCLSTQGSGSSCRDEAVCLLLGWDGRSGASTEAPRPAAFLTSSRAKSSACHGAGRLLAWIPLGLLAPLTCTCPQWLQEVARFRSYPGHNLRHLGTNDFEGAVQAQAQIIPPATAVGGLIPAGRQASSRKHQPSRAEDQLR